MFICLLINLGILVAAVSKSYAMATHINMGTNVLFSCLCGEFIQWNLVEYPISYTYYNGYLK